MQREGNPNTETFVKSELDATRERLIARYGIRGEFVGVPLLGRILDMSRTTLHDQIKQGRFGIPHRMFNRTPKVSLDELALWMADHSPLLTSSAAAMTSEIGTSKISVLHAAAPQLDNAVAEALADFERKLGFR